jgi:hypothetical protein
MKMTRPLARLIAPAIACAAMLTPGVTHAQTRIADTAAYFRSNAAEQALPVILSADERTYYRALFAAIDREDWASVEAQLASRSDGLLHPVARAEYYTHANSPRVELYAIQQWFQTGTNLPQAEQLGRLALTRGATSMPYVPATRSFEPQGYAPKRTLPRGVSDGTMPASISNAILDRIKNDDPDGARMLLDGVDASLSSEARAEWRQRVAWSYYIENNDPAALAMAETVPQGSGAWVAEGYWAAGLAAWRLGDCGRAASHFAQAANRAYNPELTAAGFYWASRAEIRCRRPERAMELLRGAAGQDETLYGLLARERLGIANEGPQQPASGFTDDDWRFRAWTMRASPSRWPKSGASRWRTRCCAIRPPSAIRASTARSVAWRARWACPKRSCGWRIVRRAE